MGAGAQMGGSTGQGGIYDPREKGASKIRKGGYWPRVQADLSKQERAKKGGKSSKTKKVGR